MGNTNPIDPSLDDFVEESKLFPLAAEGPRVVQELTGRRPNQSTVLRWAARGVAGVRLNSVFVGRCRMTTKHWLMEFWKAIAEAHNQSKAMREES